jgi:hypothetical protein
MECWTTQNDSGQVLFLDYCQVKTPSTRSVGSPRTRTWSGMSSMTIVSKSAINLECWITQDEKMVRNVFHDFVG